MDQFNLETRDAVSPEAVGVRPSDTLCLVCDYRTLTHLTKALEITDTDKLGPHLHCKRVFRARRMILDTPFSAFLGFSDRLLAFPIILDSFFKHRERRKLGRPAGAPELFHHTHGAIGISRVHEDSGGALQLGV